MKTSWMSPVWAGRLEGLLWTAVTALLLMLSLQLYVRAEAGLERYALDALMGQVLGGRHVAIKERPMAEIWQAELGYLVPPVVVSGQDVEKKFSYQWAAEKVKNSVMQMAVDIRGWLEPARTQADTARLLAAHALRQEKRYHELLAALAAVNNGEIDFAPASASYRAPKKGDGPGFIPKKIARELGEERQEYGRRKRVLEKLHPEYLAKAFAKYRARLHQAENPRARAEALRESALLLDGRKPNEDGYTVQRMLDAPRKAQRAIQASLLLRYGWLMWLGWSVWLWLAIQIGRRTERRTLAAFGYLLVLAIALAKGMQQWFGIISPLGQLHWGLGWMLLSFIFIVDRLLRSEVIKKRLEGFLPQQQARRQGISPWLMPGWLLFVGLGWLWIADLSLNFHPRLRFLLVDHATGIWVAVLLLGLLPLFAPWLLGGLVRLLGWLHAPCYRWRMLVLLPVVVFSGLSSMLLLGSKQHITGEVIKAVFIVFSAWFLLMRAPLLSHGREVMKNLYDFWCALAPAIVVCGLLVSALLVTGDNGTLLLLSICVILWAGNFWTLKYSVMLVSFVFALILSAGVGITTVGVRVQSLMDPFGAAIDDLARILWFQQEVPLSGFGLGNVPWRGYSFTESSVGLPLQLQSDYTFTGLLGVFGVGVWVLAALIAWWGLELARCRARLATIDPNSLINNPRAMREGFRAWLSTVFATLLLVQLALTVAGNNAWAPLTGITMPWLSYGNTSLWVMTIFFALLADIDKGGPYNDA